ncbi:hypothetical protein BGX21_004646 [Mortierella sp. AD011]|nr:hypothetical protein BGX20_009690 [Mortierella sp. AD010]KAF9400258.1 hypothetical protein BGX21_004646 [Mortierella sp. AD011]
MSMTSSMRKRFFAEQKKEQAQPAGQTHGTHRRLSIPFFSSQPKYEERSAVMCHKDGPYGPAGATIRARRNQIQFPLAELSDEEDDEFGTGSVPPSENNSNQQRAKFLSRLKKFLLRPSPFAKNSQDNSGSASTMPTDIRSAATVRESKSHWSRSGNNLPAHFDQGEYDSDDNSSEAPPIFPARQRTFKRWTHQASGEDRYPHSVPTIFANDTGASLPASVPSSSSPPSRFVLVTGAPSPPSWQYFETTE